MDHPITRFKPTEMPEEPIFCYANLRGLWEAGRTFAVPTYAFVIMLTLMIVTGIIREIIWGLP